MTIPSEQRSLFPDTQVLWEKSRHRYIACLMKEEVTEGFPNNLSQLLSQIQKTYRTGFIISRFLLRAKENGKLYDFYKTFVEIEEDLFMLTSLAFIFLVGLAAAAICQQLKLPRIIGMLITGIILS